MMKISEALPHILVVDDDDRLRDLLRKFLTTQGFRVTVAENAKVATQLVQFMAFDLILLDVMMPDQTGFEWITHFKSFQAPIPDTPVLFLSAQGEPNDRIEGLERGGDDYLVKPFEPKELVLRIQSILKRTQKKDPGPEIQFGPFQFDPKKETLLKGGVQIPLTSHESRLLGILTQEPGRGFTRFELADSLGEGAVTERAIDVQITRLRKKIEDEPKNPRYIKTQRNIGYIFWP